MLFPSRFENSSVVLKEAIAAKQFILCSNITANRNTLAGRRSIEEGVLEFEYGDVEDLAKKMRELLDNKVAIVEISARERRGEEMTDTFAKEEVSSVISRFTSVVS